MLFWLRLSDYGEILLLLGIQDDIDHAPFFSLSPIASRPRSFASASRISTMQQISVSTATSPW